MTIDIPENKKIIVLNVLMDERLAGPAVRVLQVAKCLKRYRIETIVCLPNGESNFVQLLEDEGIRYYQLSLKRLRATWNPFTHLTWLFYFIPNVIALSSLIKKNQVDIVHTTEIRHLQAPLAAKFSKTKLIWHLNDTTTPKPVKMLFMPWLRLLADEVVVVAKEVGRFYFGTKCSKDNICLIYEGVNTSKFNPNISPAKLQEEFCLEPSSVVIGTVANFSPVKGLEYFLEAAAIIKIEYPKIKFMIVGSKFDTQKKYWQLINSMIKELSLDENVILTGFRKEIPEIMHLMDIYVLSSVSEACPMVILEAMASGKPVVATNVGGVPEEVVDGETGILVPPKDAEAIAEAVLYLLKHPQKAKEMGVKGRERVIQHFSLERCVERHKDLYLRMLKKG